MEQSFERYQSFFFRYEIMLYINLTMKTLIDQEHKVNIQLNDIVT